MRNPLSSAQAILAVAGAGAVAGADLGLGVVAPLVDSPLAHRLVVMHKIFVVVTRSRVKRVHGAELLLLAPCTSVDPLPGDKMHVVALLGSRHNFATVLRHAADRVLVRGRDRVLEDVEEKALEEKALLKALGGKATAGKGWIH